MNIEKILVWITKKTGCIHHNDILSVVHFQHDSYWNTYQVGFGVEVPDYFAFGSSFQSAYKKAVRKFLREAKKINTEERKNYFGRIYIDDDECEYTKKDIVDCYKKAVASLEILLNENL